MKYHYALKLASRLNGYLDGEMLRFHTPHEKEVWEAYLIIHDDIMRFYKDGINSPFEAKAFLQRLCDLGLLFSIDDRGAEIWDYIENQRVFDDEYAKIYDELMEQVFNQIEDPHGTALEIMGL